MPRPSHSLNSADGKVDARDSISAEDEDHLKGVSLGQRQLDDADQPGDVIQCRRYLGVVDTLDSKHLITYRRLKSVEVLRQQIGVEPTVDVETPVGIVVRPWRRDEAAGNVFGDGAGPLIGVNEMSRSAAPPA